MPLMGPGRRMARRRVVGAAVVGGAAYHAGKRRQESAQREADQDARLDELEAQGDPYTPQEATGPAEARASPETTQLEELASLHEEGVLTDDEFAAGKAKIL